MFEDKNMRPYLGVPYVRSRRLEPADRARFRVEMSVSIATAVLVAVAFVTLCYWLTLNYLPRLRPAYTHYEHVLFLSFVLLAIGTPLTVLVIMNTVTVVVRNLHALRQGFVKEIYETFPEDNSSA